MNLTDLQAEFDARSRPGDDLLGVVRLAGVRHRVRTMRRRRFAAGGATTLIVIVAIMTGYGLISSATATQYPGSTDLTVDGFARYAVGAVVVQTHTVTLPSAEIGMTTTASDLGLTFTQRCVVPGAEEPMVLWSVDRREVGGFSCARQGGTYYTVAGATWSDLGIREGETVRITARLQAMSAGGDPVDVHNGTFAAALMRRVPFEQYPLPRRPDTLVPLTATGLPDPRTELGVAVVESDPANPNAWHTAVVAEPGAIEIRLAAQTPGSVRVVLNGVTMCTAEWWDYRAGVSDCSSTEQWPRTRPLVVTFVPQFLTGAWRAAIRS